MFPDDRDTGEEGGRLRSGRGFWSGKRRKTATKRGCCSATEREDYELAPHLN